MAAAAPSTPIPIRVRLADRKGVVRFDQQFRVDRGYDPVKIVEFDGPQGIWLMQVDAAHYGCSATTFLHLLPDLNRSIDQTLAANPSPPPVPLLIGGSAPQSLLYVHPAFVLLDKSVACDKPVGDLLDSQTVVENDQSAFFEWMYPQPPNDKPATLALQLRTPTHQYHYVHIPIDYPPPVTSWPEVLQFDIAPDEIDQLATKPTGTLICQKMFETKVYP